MNKFSPIEITHLLDLMIGTKAFSPKFSPIEISPKEVSSRSFLWMLSKECHRMPYEITFMLTLDYDLFLRIVTDPVGSKRVTMFLGRSYYMDDLIIFAIIKRFKEIMTHESSHYLVSRILKACSNNPSIVRSFCFNAWRHSLSLAHDENGCKNMKRAITKGDDYVKGLFLGTIAENAYSLCKDDLGISVIKHMLDLDFTRKSTQENTGLHELMSEFDHHVVDDSDRLLEISSKLTYSDDFFADFVKTHRGLLILHMVLGQSEEVDKIIAEKIKKRLTDIITDRFACNIVNRSLQVFLEGGKQEEYIQMLEEIARNAISISTNFTGSTFVQYLIEFRMVHLTGMITRQLFVQSRYLELSLDQHGSEVVKKLLCDRRWCLPLLSITNEILESDENKLVRLAKDYFGNKVLIKTLESAKKHNMVDSFEYIAAKLKPIVHLLRGSQADNIVAIIESEIIKDSQDYDFEFSKYCYF